MADSLAEEIRKKWKPRKKQSHKGDYGRVFILAGSQNYSGAAYLSGLSALRAGAGLVTLGVPDSIHSIVARRQPELIVKPLQSNSDGSLSSKNTLQLLKFSQTQDVLAAGPGLSQNPDTQKLIQKLVQKVSVPLVIDADGLNALQGRAVKLLSQRRGDCILTPHPGEFVRLFGGKLSANDAERKKRASEAAQKTGCVIVLKGFRTVAAAPDGKVYVNPTGNPGMATAGTGDVLTGIIAALLGQKFSAWDSARFSVYLHGLAGDFAAREKGEVSLIAGDLIEFLPRAIRHTCNQLTHR